MILEFAPRLRDTLTRGIRKAESGNLDKPEAHNKMKTELEGRTKRFSLDLILILKSLPKGYLGDVIGRQLLKSGTSIGTNYREANRAESKADFVHKVNLSEKEAAETVYWLEICMEASLGTSAEIERLAQEAKELLAILTTIGRNTKR